MCWKQWNIIIKLMINYGHDQPLHFQSPPGDPDLEEWYNYKFIYSQNGKL